jgi:hypothetical protein
VAAEEEQVTVIKLVELEDPELEVQQTEEALDQEIILLQLLLKEITVELAKAAEVTDVVEAAELILLEAVHQVLVRVAQEDLQQLTELQQQDLEAAAKVAVEHLLMAVQELAEVELETLQDKLTLVVAEAEASAMANQENQVVQELCF